MIVIDTNVIVAVCMPGPNQSIAMAAREKEQWSAPVVWRSEFLSAMSKCIRLGAVDLSQAQDLLRNAEYLMITRDFRSNGHKALELVTHTPVSSYDAEFIALAQDHGTHLVTLDQALIVHFPETAIHLLDFVGRSRP